MDSPDVNLWQSPVHANDYLCKADTIPHRSEGEDVLLEFLPETVGRVLDLGSGDGRLLALAKLNRPNATAVALDFSPTMIDRLRARFAADTSIEVVVHDLAHPLPQLLGRFDAIISSFAIHHLPHQRKRSLYGELFELLNTGGVFCNLEHVASPTIALHHEFLAALSLAPDEEDPSNKLLDVETQLQWLRATGFDNVDCHWKWRELALLAGDKLQ
jgi:tRNA (cmo5U34)-methyltransferase